MFRQRIVSESFRILLTVKHLSATSCRRLVWNPAFAAGGRPSQISLNCFLVFPFVPALCGPSIGGGAGLRTRFSEGRSPAPEHGRGRPLPFAPEHQEGSPRLSKTCAVATRGGTRAGRLRRDVEDAVASFVKALERFRDVRPFGQFSRFL